MKNKLLFIVLSTLSIFYFPNQNFGQAPNLGTVANFVLFTTNGAITNTGSSHLTGHVGSNVGSSTGFGNVDGVMHNQDPASAQATLDLNALYLELDAKVPTSFPGILLGNNQTLNPGVHSSPASATLSNILYLDAQNDPNAIFIFQIDGTFSANANSKVILLNSAQACNVYWKIEGAVSLATGTSMKGSIVANNSAINISASDTLEGRALSLNGAIGVNQLFAYTPLGCGTPVLTGPANPALGTTECYVLFSGIGAVTNTGDTYASGDIGSNSGQANGFNPLFITGTIHVNPDASTAQCATDFNNVYNDLTALPYDIELLYPAQFGNNLVLTPHVYLMNGAVTFTDSLYLNAQENPNAVFVFQVKGAFNTSTLSRVKLINGAQAKNVYWLIDGAVEVNNLSIFNGTIISQGAIKLNSGVKLNGRALTGVGSVTTEAISAFMPTSCSPYTITEPTDQTVCKGTTANFTVNASGSNLTYQWRKGSVDLNNGGNISGVDTETLTISPAGLSDAANNYNVIISGSFTPNDTSEYVTLSIISAPSIISQPNDQTGCVGDSIGFSIVGDGVGLTYQWRKGLTNLSNGGSISGANTANLSIDPISVLDFDATYNVVLTGTCAPDTISRYITLSSGNCGFDLSISKSASNMEPQYDSIVTFTVIARNIGSRTGTDVGVNEILQNGFEFLSYRSTSGTYDEITGVWTIGNMISAATDTLNIQVKILAGGNYENKVNIYANETDDNMANNRASIELRPFDFHIPEGFSPNNDQVNDLYVIRGISRFPNNQISIYNRWGVRVFTDSPYTNSWDGKSQSASNVGGDKLPVGTYFYILDLGDGSPIYKGTIYLNL